MPGATDLDAWLAGKLAELYKQEPKSDPGIMVGTLLFGKEYIDRFVTFCVPSMMTPANLAGLRAMNAKIVIVTTSEDFLPVWRAVAPLERVGLRVELDYIPKTFLTDRDAIQRALGAVQSLLLQKCARSEMGFHMNQPDVLYSIRFFEALAGLVGEHEAIAQSCLSADVDAIEPDLASFRQGKALAIPARTLGTLAWKHAHGNTKAALMNKRADLPAANWLIWEGRDAIHIASCFANPTWLGPRLCRQAPILSPITLDAELPALMPDGFHLPGPDDDILLVELSTGVKGQPGGATQQAFSDIFWTQMNFDETYLRILRRRTLVPIEPHDGGWPDEQIERDLAVIYAELAESQVEAMKRWFKMFVRSRNHLLRDIAKAA